MCLMNVLLKTRCVLAYGARAASWSAACHYIAMNNAQRYFYRCHQPTILFQFPPPFLPTFEIYLVSIVLVGLYACLSGNLVLDKLSKLLNFITQVESSIFVSAVRIPHTFCISGHFIQRSKCTSLRSWLNMLSFIKRQLNLSRLNRNKPKLNLHHNSTVQN